MPSRDVPPTRLDYDASGNLTITDPTGIRTSVTLTAEGLIDSIADALGHTLRLSYEGGYLAGITDATGNTTRRFVDGAGRLLGVTDALGRLMLYAYDPLNNLTQVTDPIGGVVRFDYDANSNLHVITDQRRTPFGTTTYDYDNMDRLIQRTDPLGRLETFGDYDFAGDLGKYTDRRGKVAVFSYDRLGRITFAGFGRTGPDTSPTYESSVTYSDYDGASRLQKVVDSVSGTILRGFDGLDNLTCESKGTSPPCTASQPGVVTYAYDPQTGRRQTLTLSGQPTVTYTFDNADRLTGITQGSATVTITPDAAGRRGVVTLPNGGSMTYGYDAASRVSSIQYKKGDGSSWATGPTATMQPGM